MTNNMSMSMTTTKEVLRGEWLCCMTVTCETKPGCHAMQHRQCQCLTICFRIWRVMQLWNWTRPVMQCETLSKMHPDPQLALRCWILYRINSVSVAIFCIDSILPSYVEGKIMRAFLQICAADQESFCLSVNANTNTNAGINRNKNTNTNTNTKTNRIQIQI